MTVNFHTLGLHPLLDGMFMTEKDLSFQEQYFFMLKKQYKKSL